MAFPNDWTSCEWLEGKRYIARFELKYVLGIAVILMGQCFCLQMWIEIVLNWIEIYVMNPRHINGPMSCCLHLFYGTFANIWNYTYRQISKTRCTLAGNQNVDHSHVVGASPVGAAPTTSSFSTWHLASIDCAKTTARHDEKHLSFGIWCELN